MENDKSWLLNERQRPIVATAVTVFSVAILLTAIYYCFVLLRDLVGTFSHVLLPLAIAAILATLLQPLVNFFDRKLHLGRVGSIVLLWLLVLGVVAGLAIYLIPILIDQIRQFVQAAPELQKSMFAFLREQLPGLWYWLQQQFDLGSLQFVFAERGAEAKAPTGATAAVMQESFKQLLEALRVGGSYLVNFFGLVAAYAVIPVYLSFLLYSRNEHDRWNDIERELSFLSDQRREDLIFLIRQFTEIIISFFRGQMLVGLILGIFLAVGFQIIGLQLGLILGLIAGLINIIPYLGTILGLGTALPLAYFQADGGWVLVGLVLGIFTIGQLLVDYVVLPRVMGERTGMGPMLIIFSVFFWGTALNGLLGMVLAIPLTAFFLVFWRLLRDKYIPMMKLHEPDAPRAAPPAGNAPAEGTPAGGTSADTSAPGESAH